MSFYSWGSPTSSVPPTGSNYIDSLLSQVKWGDVQGTGATLTYSFPWTINETASWEDNYQEPNAVLHYGLSNIQQAAAINALQAWANVANITFTEITETETDVGDMRFAFSSSVDEAGAWDGAISLIHIGHQVVMFGLLLH